MAGRRYSRPFVAGAVLCVGFLLWSVAIKSRTEPVADARNNGPSRLDRPATCSAEQQTLRDILTRLAAEHETAIRVESFGNVDNRLNEIMSFRCRQPISLKSLLLHLMAAAGVPDCAVLEYSDHIAIIDAKWNSQSSSYVTRVHTLERLLLTPTAIDIDNLIDAVMVLGEYDWEDYGGRGFVRPLPGALLVYHSEQTHQQIEGLVRGLETAQSGIEPIDLEPVARELVPLRTALSGKKRDIHFVDAELRAVVAWLSTQYNVPIFINTRELDDVGIGLDVPITLPRLQKLSLRSALRLVLQQLDLVFIVRDEGIVVTTPEDAEAKLRVRIYPVPELLSALNDNGDTLIELTTSTVAPMTWDEVGGPGSIMMCGSNLVVSQTDYSHGEVESLLDELRFHLFLSLRPEHQVVDASPVRQFRRALRAKPMQDQQLVGTFDAVLHKIFDGIDVNLLFDTRALDDVGLTSEMHVEVVCHNVDAEDAFVSLLDRFYLTWNVRNESLVITTYEESESVLTTRILPLHHLADEIGSLHDLRESIVTLIDEHSWDEVGGPGSLEVIGPLMIVSQTDKVLEEIELFLNALSDGLEDPALAMQSVHKDDEAAYEKLRQEVSLTVINASLADTVMDLARRYDLPLVFSDEAPEPHVEAAPPVPNPFGGDPDESTPDPFAVFDTEPLPRHPVTYRGEGVPLADVFKSILQPWSFAAVVDGSTIAVVPEDEVVPSYLCIYPVPDLVDRWDDDSSQGLQAALNQILGHHDDRQYGMHDQSAVLWRQVCLVKAGREKQQQIQSTLSALRGADGPEHHPDHPERKFVRAYDAAGVAAKFEELSNLARFVANIVETASWRLAPEELSDLPGANFASIYTGDAWCFVLDGRLVVFHNAEAHRQVHELFEVLRQADGIPADLLFDRTSSDNSESIHDLLETKQPMESNIALAAMAFRSQLPQAFGESVLARLSDTPATDADQAALLLRALRACKVDARSACDKLMILFLESEDSVVRAEVLATVFGLHDAQPAFLFDLARKCTTAERRLASDLLVEQEDFERAVPIVLLQFLDFETRTANLLQKIDAEGKRARRILKQWQSSGDPELQRYYEAIYPTFHRQFGDEY